ncbi:MAG: protein kinase [Trueperaceae bacterium]|nr:protein kinase [Trueperaceae bacterium]
MFQPGEVIDDRYEVIGTLGVGGMAHVFRAKDAHLEREVALKVLRPHLTESDSERFRREIRALARLNHPGIVNIYDLGLGQHVYFAMELIEGGPITELGPFEPDPEPAAKLLGASVTVAEALGYVHKLGMVHRDLTPRNVLVTPQGAPKVMDFGLVQLTETSKRLTRTGITLGTPQYMAPEQATGESTGAATDLYAFGAVLYRMVTGVNAFDGENDQAVLYQHVYGSVVHPLQHNPQLPDALAGLIMDLLEKEPDRRPSSGYVVADRLRAILAEIHARSFALPLGGPGRTGSYPHGPPAPRELVKRWTVDVGEGPQFPSGLAAANGFLLLGQRSDSLAVLRPADGGLHATFPLLDEAYQAPLVVGERLYLVSRDGSLDVLSWPGGEALWRKEDADVLGAAPYGRDIVVAAGDHVELWSAEGVTQWRVKLDSQATCAPTVHGGLALVPTTGGWLHAVRLAQGTHVFKVEVGVLAAPPSAADGMAYLPVRAGELHAFDLRAREVAWSYDLEGEQWSTPVVWGQHLFAVSWGQRLHALAARSGDDLWARPLPAAVTATPVLAAGTLFLGTEGGDLLGFDARSGRSVFSDKVSNAAIQASPLPVGGRLFVAALDGRVAAFG